MLRYILFSSIFLWCSTIDAQFRDHLKKEIEKIVFYDTEVSLDDIPGYIIGVQMGDSTYVYSYGSISRDFKKTPTDSTVYEIGGITKVFTASLAGLLVEEGLMDFDSSLNFYLPNNLRGPYASAITIRDLIMHTSQLPRMPFEFGLKEKEINNPYAHYTNNDLMDFYKNFLVDNKKKKVYEYSHVNYALLEKAIEYASGKSFESLLNEKILAPLGMSSTFIDQDQISNNKEFANGYSRSGRATDPWTFSSFRGSEGLKSSTKDLINFMNANLGITPHSLTEKFNAFHEPLLHTKMTRNTWIGTGWHVIKLKKYHNVILHSGSTSGYRAFMGFVKETNTGVVILSNSEKGMQGLGLLILRMINYNWKKKK